MRLTTDPLGVDHNPSCLGAGQPGRVAVSQPKAKGRAGNAIIGFIASVALNPDHFAVLILTYWLPVIQPYRCPVGRWVEVTVGLVL